MVASAVACLLGSSVATAGAAEGSCTSTSLQRTPGFAYVEKVIITNTCGSAIYAMPHAFGGIDRDARGTNTIFTDQG
ncbi:hypothetical protein [Pseudonocardia sp. GCM10023141]|uniref:hypothetical protein n=1 Tax=Pseudonocardia sp. GCM10023141 TaxID=3252653 RepID=UPI00361A64F4